MGRNQEDGQQGRYPGGSLFKTTQPGWRGRQSILQTTGRCLMIFKLLDLCWKLSTVERRHSRRFLEHVEGNFLTQIMCVSQQGKTSLDLLFVNREGLGVMWWSETVLGMVRALTKWELSILGEGREGINKTSALAYQRADLGLFRTVVQRVPCETVRNNNGIQEGWTDFEEKILKAQEQPIPICQKMSRGRGKEDWPGWIGSFSWNSG